MDTRALPILIILILLAGGLAVGLVVLFDQIDHLTVWVMAVLLLGMWVVPPGLRLLHGEFDLFEPTVPYGAMNFLYYGAGSLFVLHVPGVAYSPSVLQFLDLAATYCALGYACVLAGYHLGGRIVRPLRGHPGPSPGPVAIGVVYLIGCGGDYSFAILERIPIEFRPVITGTTSLIMQLNFLATFAIMYACYLFMSGRASVGFKALLFGVMLPTQIVSLIFRFGNKTPLFLALGLPILAYWYAKRRIAWKSLTVILAISIFIIFPLYYTVRNYRSQYYSQRYRIERTVESMTKEKANVFAQGALLTTAKRVALVNSTATVIRDCGSRVEYQMGDTIWLGVVSAAIPRFIWANKPTTTTGIEFGKIFHVTTFGNYSYISPSQAGELYWNFHVPGIIVGMFLFGLFLSAVYLRFGVEGGKNPVRLAIYVTIMYAFLVNSDGTLAGLEGSMFKEISILLLIEKGFEMMEIYGRPSQVQVARAPAAAMR